MITGISNWQEEHSQQVRMDHSEIVEYLRNIEIRLSRIENGDLRP